MVCDNCGAELSSEDVFCPKCGKKVELHKERKKLQSTGNKKIYRLIVLLIVVLGLVIGISVIVKQKDVHTIDLTPFVICETSGCNGSGDAYAYFDMEAFAEEYGDIIEPEDGYSLEMLCNEVINGDSQDIYGTASNGDAFTWVWDIDDKVALKKYHCKFKYDDIVFTVTELPDIVSFDPFKDLEYSYAGISGHGSIELTNVQDEIPLTYTFDRDSGLKNGDVITLSVESPNSMPVDQYCRDVYGVELNSLTKTFHVGLLPYYAEFSGDITRTVLHYMCEQSELALNEEREITSKKIHVTSFKPSRLFFYMRPDYDYRNWIILVSEVTIHGDYDHDESLNDFTFWYCSAFRGLLLTPGNDDEYSFEQYLRFNGSATHDFARSEEENISMGYTFPAEGVTFEGYKSLNDCISRIVSEFETRDGFTLINEDYVSTDKQGYCLSKTENESTKETWENSKNLVDCMYDKNKVGFQVIDTDGNQYDTAILIDGNTNCMFLDGEYKKIKGNLCLMQGADREVTFSFSANSEDTAYADDYNEMRRIFDSDNVIFETTLTPDGGKVPFEIDLTNYWTLGWFAKQEMNVWPKHLKVIMTDIELK